MPDTWPERFLQLIFVLSKTCGFLLFSCFGANTEKLTAVIPERPVYAVSFVNVDLLVYKVSSRAVHGAKELQSLEDEVCVTDVTGFEVKVSA